MLQVLFWNLNFEKRWIAWNFLEILLNIDSNRIRFPSRMCCVCVLSPIWNLVWALGFRPLRIRYLKIQWSVINRWLDILHRWNRSSYIFLSTFSIERWISNQFSAALRSETNLWGAWVQFFISLKLWVRCFVFDLSGMGLKIFSALTRCRSGWRFRRSPLDGLHFSTSFWNIHRLSPSTCVRSDFTSDISILLCNRLLALNIVEHTSILRREMLRCRKLLLYAQIHAFVLILLLPSQIAVD